nr:hypothetical protein [Achromobacter piechaudii]
MLVMLIRPPPYSAATGLSAAALITPGMAPVVIVPALLTSIDPKDCVLADNAKPNKPATLPASPTPTKTPPAAFWTSTLLLPTADSAVLANEWGTRPASIVPWLRTVIPGPVKSTATLLVTAPAVAPGCVVTLIFSADEIFRSAIEMPDGSGQRTRSAGDPEWHAAAAGTPDNPKRIAKLVCVHRRVRTKPVEDIPARDWVASSDTTCQTFETRFQTSR